MEMKLLLVSPATALASMVFPVPGGPWSSTPLGASTPSLLKSSGCLSGSSTISRIFLTASPSPPMSSYETFGTSPLFAAGLSETFTSVVLAISTASPDGAKDVTIRSILLPITFSVMVSPLARALPSRTCLRYSSPPCSLSCSVGANVIFSAFFAATFLTATLSSRETPALRLVDPSILMIPRFASSGAPLRTFATVFLLPSICTMSPTLIPRMSISSGSSLAIPLPVSPGFNSATLIAFSFTILIPPFRLSSVRCSHPCPVPPSRDPRTPQRSRSSPRPERRAPCRAP